MTDKELLELAAKAAGAVELDGNLFVPNGAAGKSLFNPDGAVSTGWNPLADDGDALRLAVKLGICCKYERNAPPELKIPRECAVAITNDGKWIAESDERDRYAATRRAIVRAAAEIGKALDSGKCIDKNNNI